MRGGIEFFDSLIVTKIGDNCENLIHGFKNRTRRKTRFTSDSRFFFPGFDRFFLVLAFQAIF